MWQNIAGVGAMILAGAFYAASCWLMVIKGREKSGKSRKKGLSRKG